MHQHLRVDLVDIVGLVGLKDELVKCVYKFVLGLHLPVQLLELSLCLHGIFALVLQVGLDSGALLAG